MFPSSTPATEDSTALNDAGKYGGVENDDEEDMLLLQSMGVVVSSSSSLGNTNSNSDAFAKEAASYDAAIAAVLGNVGDDDEERMISASQSEEQQNDTAAAQSGELDQQPVVADDKAPNDTTEPTFSCCCRICGKGPSKDRPILHFAPQFSAFFPTAATRAPISAAPSSQYTTSDPLAGRRIPQGTSTSLASSGVLLPPSQAPMPSLMPSLPSPGLLMPPPPATLSHDICLHVFCGKTAGILPTVNQPELEILTKAGIKNKHGIGAEVNAALSRTRSADLILDANNLSISNKSTTAPSKEKQYYLVREFEAHLAMIRSNVHSAAVVPQQQLMSYVSSSAAPAPPSSAHYSSPSTNDVNANPVTTNPPAGAAVLPATSGIPQNGATVGASPGTLPNSPLHLLGTTSDLGPGSSTSSSLHPQTTQFHTPLHVHENSVVGGASINNPTSSANDIGAIHAGLHLDNSTTSDPTGTLLPPSVIDPFLAATSLSQLPMTDNRNNGGTASVMNGNHLLFNNTSSSILPTGSGIANAAAFLYDTTSHTNQNTGSPTLEQLEALLLQQQQLQQLQRQQLQQQHPIFHHASMLDPALLGFMDIASSTKVPPSFVPTGNYLSMPTGTPPPAATRSPSTPNGNYPKNNSSKSRNQIPAKAAAGRHTQNRSGSHSDTKILCACGGSYIGSQTAKGVASWQKHIASKRHQKYLERESRDIPMEPSTLLQPPVNGDHKIDDDDGVDDIDAAPGYHSTTEAEDAVTTGNWYTTSTSTPTAEEAV